MLRGAHICETCGRSYKHRRSLQTHKRVECGKSPRLACPHCSYMCKHTSHMKSHMRNHHSQRLSCPYCSYSTTEPGKFEAHASKHPGDMIYLYNTNDIPSHEGIQRLNSSSFMAPNHSILAPECEIRSSPALTIRPITHLDNSSIDSLSIKTSDWMTSNTSAQLLSDDPSSHFLSPSNDRLASM